MLDFLLLKTARVFNRFYNRLQNVIVSRYLKGTRCVIWEIKYSDVNALKALVLLMNTLFPKKNPALKNLILLVNNGKDGEYEVYLIVALYEQYWEEYSETLNSIPGIVQTFIHTPERLLSFAIRGDFYLAADVTPKTVDELYGKRRLG